MNQPRNPSLQRPDLFHSADDAMCPHGPFDLFKHVLGSRIVHGPPVARIEFAQSNPRTRCVEQKVHYVSVAVRACYMKCSFAAIVGQCLVGTFLQNIVHNLFKIATTRIIIITVVVMIEIVSESPVRVPRRLPRAARYFSGFDLLCLHLRHLISDGAELSCFRA